MPRKPVSENAYETARYIEEMARELKELASKSDLGFLAYLLALVESDAASTVERLETMAGRRETM